MPRAGSVLSAMTVDGPTPLRGARRALALVAVCVAAYGLYPYVTLFYLADAIRRGDEASLEPLVAWESVREGIKEDICDAVLAEPDSQTADARPVDAAEGRSIRDPSRLPPFGFSFVRGIAANAIDAMVTARGIVSAARAGAPHEGTAKATPSRESATLDSSATRRSSMPGGDTVHVAWAFFDEPGGFVVELRPAGAGQAKDSVRLHMDLKNGQWRVTRVWLPPDMLQGANSRT